MLSEYLRIFWDAREKLSTAIRDEHQRDLFIMSKFSEDDCNLLVSLIITRNFSLPAFYILLKIKPELAIDTLKSWYLSIDMSKSPKNLAADLIVMFDDIKEILGEEKLKEVLDSPEFLPKNKRNKLVKEAIAFAFDED